VSRRDDVLEALRDTGGRAVSGEDLARRLGVSRVAVGKHVSALREAGYLIEAVPGRGYALLGVPDAPLPAEVRRWLRSTIWQRLEGGGETGSTNADAVALARAGAVHGTGVLASRQTAGRGRLGRSWESPSGGVYVSAVLRPSLAPAEVTGMPLAVATGVARAVERFGVEADVKWPNDVRLGGGKLAGVLLEISAEADRTLWLVVGVGLNVRRPEDPTPGAAYLADRVEGVGLAEAAAAVLDGISEGYRLLADEGFEAVREAFSPRDGLAGRRVCVRDASGQVVAEGRADGVDDAGRLRVAGDDGVVAVVSGDVTLAGERDTGPRGRTSRAGA